MRLHSLALNPKLGIIAATELPVPGARCCPQGYEVLVAAIKEEAFSEIESRGTTVHWLSLGELSKLIETFRREGVTRPVMAGQVKHRQFFQHPSRLAPGEVAAETSLCAP